MPRALSIASSITYSRTKASTGLKRRRHFQEKRGRALFLSFFVSLLILGFFIFYLYLNIQLVELNFNLKEKEGEIKALETEIQKLESQINKSLSIERLRGVATDLDLVSAEDVRYLEPKKTGSLSMENP
jgi:cell division protein FtsL